MTGRRRRLLIGLAAAVVVLAPLAFFWQRSLVPGELSPMTMGYADYGGGPATAAGHAGHERDIKTFDVPTNRPADVVVELVARAERFDIAGRGPTEGYTLNHSSPGPRITAKQGQLIQVTLRNESVPDGITLHWHGVDVPAAADGVAGVTQDAVRPGQSFVYRFIARDAGTYWYHSHQVSHEQVKKGLFGPLVISPGPADVVAAVHTYDKIRTVNGQYGEHRVDAAPGSVVRVRLINTDNGPMATWVDGAPYAVVSVDGTDVHEPGQVNGKSVLVTAGGRIDLRIRIPSGSAVRLGLGGGPTTLVLGAGDAPTGTEPADRVDLLSYGTPAPTGLDASSPDRRFEYRIGRRPGFLDGRPGLWWTINGHLYPDGPMFMVADGDVVVMTIKNTSGQVHPMHLHGHHVLVLSRDGVKASGSPWWTDSLNVEDGETFEIAFKADNPGVWMDHCHNLDHAAQGLVTHLMYVGVNTPYKIGGTYDNEPE
ncbi:FtsP/CotA-like multicopper oxidase with cupredoxin domain [Kribbella amoyensis]|uniref:FtsP/CotA-like multicopper oxidase with cupredoxin domain n=1 Tax=Kribbella amoyensis TaxID=996641 RepID=A0A561BLX9_9ACTN|nr:multicopper oxidase family protein [Kribbella amoyensis]TWD79843.1 FtsP/CotA-like multicopper oxidase with cupredoxin domain [Kribbella amoyensis]